MSSMNPYQWRGAQPQSYEATSAETLGAIARFMNAVYAWMCAGLALTAVVAWWVATQTNILLQLGNGIWLLFIVEIGLVIAISRATRRLSATAATALFLLYAALNGVTLSVIFMIYTHALLASAFAITAGMFGITSVYGFVTRRDLTAVGSIAFMALIGLVIAMVVSIFWHPSWLSVAINFVGVIVFVALTAYDTQNLKAWAIQTAGNGALAGRMAINGALSLYLDFLNLFLFIVSIMGDRR